MRIIPTELKGACLVEIEPVEDSRGSFSRLWCKQEFRQHEIDMTVVQISVSHNIAAGTFRGLHFQWPPSTEAKLVRCERGRIHDVVVDLRPESPTFTQHVAFELEGRAHNALYIPPGFAHGFQTLEADSDIVYMMSDYYRPDLQGGVRFDDPVFDIAWPLPIASITPRDRDYAEFNADDYCRRYSQVSKNNRSRDDI